MIMFDVLYDIHLIFGIECRYIFQSFIQLLFDF